MSCTSGHTGSIICLHRHTDPYPEAAPEPATTPARPGHNRAEFATALAGTYSGVQVPGAAPGNGGTTDRWLGRQVSGGGSRGGGGGGGRW